MLVDLHFTFDGAETIEMPRFSEHNGQSAKRRAEDFVETQARRKKERRRHRNLSENDADKKRTRGQREEKAEQRLTPVPGRLAAPTPMTRRRPESRVDLRLVRQKRSSIWYHGTPDNPKCGLVLNDARRRASGPDGRKRLGLPARCSATDPRRWAQGVGRVFAVCAASDFLTGKAPPQKGKPPFIADIDFDVAVRLCQDAREQVLTEKQHERFPTTPDEADNLLRADAQPRS